MKVESFTVKNAGGEGEALGLLPGLLALQLAYCL
jgi:hypothetical protein